MVTLLERFDTETKVRSALLAERRAKIQAQWAEEDRNTKKAWDAWLRFINEKGEREATIASYRRRIKLIPYIHTPEQWNEAVEYNNAEYKKITEELHGDPTIRFRLDILRDLRLPLPM